MNAEDSEPPPPRTPENLLREHRKQWKNAYYQADGDSKPRHVRFEPRHAVAWIRKKRAAYARRDALFGTTVARGPGLLGMGSNSPVVLFLVKEPAPTDERKGRPFADAKWRPLLDWADSHARGYHYLAYLVPRRIPRDDPSLPGLTDQRAAGYGWYVRCLLETLRPRLVVSLGKDASRAAVGKFVVKCMADLRGMRDLYAREHDLSLVLADDSRTAKLKVVCAPDPGRLKGRRRGRVDGAQLQKEEDEHRQAKREERAADQTEETVDLDALPLWDADALWKVCFTQVDRSYRTCLERSRGKRRLTGDQVCERLMGTRGRDPAAKRSRIDPESHLWHAGIDRTHRTQDEERFEVVRVPLRLTEEERMALALKNSGELQQENDKRAEQGLPPLRLPARTWVPKYEKAARDTFTLEGGRRRTEARSGPLDRFVKPMPSPVETSNPVEMSNPAEMSNPVEVSDPVEMSNPVEMSDHAEMSNPVEKPGGAASEEYRIN